jgi:hypothetical protein
MNFKFSECLSECFLNAEAGNASAMALDKGGNLTTDGSADVEFRGDGVWIGRRAVVVSQPRVTRMAR